MLNIWFSLVFMVLDATFNNISVTLCWSVLLVEEIADLPQVTNKLYHIMLYWVYLVWAWFKLTALVVIGTDCIGSCKSNYHTITTTTALIWYRHREMRKIISHEFHHFLNKTRILRVLHIAIHCPLPAAKIRGPKILEVSPCSD